MLKPFIKKLSSTDDGRQIGHIRKYIFTYLMRQSDLGMEYQAKYEAWKQVCVESKHKIFLLNLII